MKKFAAVRVGSLPLVCTPLFIQHGNAEFEMDKAVGLQANITEFLLGNPHGIPQTPGQVNRQLSGA